MISTWKLLDIIIFTFFMVATIRQSISFCSMVRVSRFLRKSRSSFSAAGWTDSSKIYFVIVIPVLREQLIIEETVSYFSRLALSYKAKLVFITCERELKDNGKDERNTTIDLLQKLQHRNGAQFIHLHLTNAEGIKSDQLNYFADVSHEIWPDLKLEDTFALIYDADSRPDPESIQAFKKAILSHCNSNIFQQSSLFWPNRNDKSRFNRLFSTCEALRASRFVFAYELPRLIGRMTFAEGHRDLLSLLSKMTYSHVTGHGLCIRLSFLKKQPFSSRVVMEDMNYGFRMCCLGETVIPVAYFDNAQVPANLRESVRQACRWFLGPARSLSYLADPFVTLNMYSVLIACSAFTISLEWLSCAVLPVLSFVGLFFSARFVQIAICLFVILYLITCLYATQLCSRYGLKGLRYSILIYPIVCTVFGIAGFLCIFNILLGKKNFFGQTTEKAETRNQ